MRVSADKAGKGCIIDPPVHMDQVNLLNILVPGKAFVGKGQLSQIERVVKTRLALPRQVSQLTPGIKAAAIHYVGIGISYEVNAAQRIFVQIAGLGALGRRDNMLGDKGTIGVDVVFLIDLAGIAFGELFIQAANVEGFITFVVQLAKAGAIGAVAEAR